MADLLAHTDLFAAGIAHSGSYNETNQPFGYRVRESVEHVLWEQLVWFEGHVREAGDGG